MSSDGNLPSNSNSRRTIRQLIDQLNNQLSGSAADNLQVRESVQDINQSLRPNPPRSSAQENQLQNAQQPTSSASLTASLNVNPAISEHRRLFSRQSRIQPYRRQNGRSSSRTASRGKTITKSIFCLARKDQTQVSSASEKLQLHENGLGEKRISFPSTASSGEVKDILYKHYPVLKYVGGMQLLLSKESARKELHVVSHGCCNAEQLKCFGTGRVYIRPLQKDIPLEKNDNTDVQFEECLSCQALIAINEMQEHLKQCGSSDSGSEGSDQEINDPMKQTDFVEDVEIHPTTASECSDLVSGQGIDSHPVEVVIVSDDIATADADMSNNNYKSFHEHRARAIEDTLMELGDCQEPVTVLRIYQKNFMRGRPLDLMNETTIMEGETTEIFVSRLNLFEDGMDEILNVTSETVDRSFPLEVTFTGENARDQGGPRREFLSSMLQQIKERLCTEGEDGNFNLCDNLVARTSRFYVGAGIIFGYTLLQGGPLPCFFSENQLQRLFTNTNTEEKMPQEIQFLEGLASFGLDELIMRRPILIYLFRRTAVSPMTYPKIVKLMKPNFSEEGSNRRILEEQSYRHFLKYCKEVAAGRRGVMKLENILKFVSGSEYEPVLGFSISPQIDFVMSESSYPTANTCINKLCLVIGDKMLAEEQRRVDVFDLAFANTYFGMV